MDKREKGEKRGTGKDERKGRKRLSHLQKRSKQSQLLEREKGNELLWEKSPIGVYDTSGISPNFHKIR